MGYVENILEPGERILHRAHLHWIVYGPAVGFALGALGCLILAAPGNEDKWLGLALTAFLLLAVTKFLTALISRYTTEIAVTDQRVISKMGLIKRDTIEINAAKVESVDVRQSILGRFLDYGTVIVSGTGWKALPMVSVAKPLELRRAVGRISSNVIPRG